jgi:hypothetical protein
MTKPHEEEWTEHPSNTTARDGGGWVISENGEGPIIVTVHDSPERTKFVAAAPRMARALLKRLGTWAPCLCHLTTPDMCDNCVDRAMLREAGVL